MAREHTLSDLYRDGWFTRQAQNNAAAKRNAGNRHIIFRVEQK
ncbi:hypothetical protein KDK_67070 [Dictyobacter kobayashii]|uniref:Uncharacterized protein n=1 Tax=Dictyobacter kobayashii TaxID=2014872 RepID=A0A402AUZ5_9CHLR|nr:hypothetical protein KDK_67070 [Dictyobacter kobayashii]